MKKEKKTINWKEEFEKLKNPKELKKLLIALFIEIAVLIMLFVACDKMLSTEDDSEQEIVQKEEQTQVEQKTQQIKIETEQEYFAQAKPFIEQIITETENVKKIIESSSSVEEWKKAIPYAQNCITLSKEIQNLKITDELILKKGIVELGHTFGLSTERASKHFIEGLETQNIEQLQNWVENEEPEMVILLHEIDAYVQGGKRIQEQLREELKGILTDEEIENVNIPSKTSTATFAIYAAEEEKEGLIKICEILKIMGLQNKYDYLDTYFVIGYPYPEEMFLIPIRLKKETRQGIDLNTISDTNIIDIADEYSVVTSGGVVLYEK